MALDPKLLEILACPEDKGPLLYFASENTLYNPRLKLKYRIDDDVPQMLAEEAKKADATEDARLVELARSSGITPNF
ncbi:MAG: Trm112 family protein [Archangium sp.]